MMLWCHPYYDPSSQPSRLFITYAFYFKNFENLCFFLKMVLRGHTDYVHSVTTRNAGQECVSASEDGTARIFGRDLFFFLSILRCCQYLFQSEYLVSLLLGFV